MNEKHPRDTIYTIGLHDKESVITGYITLQEKWGTTKINIHTEDGCLNFQIFADELQLLSEAIIKRLKDIGLPMGQS